MKNVFTNLKKIITIRLVQLAFLVGLITSFVSAITVYSQSETSVNGFLSYESVKNLFFDTKVVKPSSDLVSTLNSATNLENRVLDKSLSLNGKGYVEIANSKQFRTNAFTIEAWIKYTQTENRQGIVQISDDKGQNLKIDLLKDGRIESTISETSRNLDRVETLDTVSPNSWHHVALVFNKGSLKIFVDGNLSVENLIGVESFLLGQKIKIGLTSEKKGRNYFNGFIDEVRIANFARYDQNSNPDIKSIGTIPGESYIGVWRFEDSNIVDYSNEGQKGKPFGEYWFSNDLFSNESKTVANFVDFCGTTQVTNSFCRRFDEFPSFFQLENAYSGVAFRTSGSNGFITDDHLPPTSTGISLPNTMSGWSYSNGNYNYFAPLSVEFPSAVNNLSFRVIGLDSHQFGYAQVQITQENGLVTNTYLNSFGTDVPVDYYVGNATCGMSLCNKVKKFFYL